MNEQSQLEHVTFTLQIKFLKEQFLKFHIRGDVTTSIHTQFAKFGKLNSEKYSKIKFKKRLSCWTQKKLIECPSSLFCKPIDVWSEKKIQIWYAPNFFLHRCDSFFDLVFAWCDPKSPFFLFSPKFLIQLPA